MLKSCWLSLTLLCQALLWSTAFLPPSSLSTTSTPAVAAAGSRRAAAPAVDGGRRAQPPPSSRRVFGAVPSNDIAASGGENDNNNNNNNNNAADVAATTMVAAADRKNAAYIDGLLDNLTANLDKYILTGSAVQRDSIYNVLRQIELRARDAEQVQLARRRIQRAGLPVPTGSTAGEGQQQQQQQQQAKELGRTDDERRRQEAEQRRAWETRRAGGESVASAVNGSARSALSRRSTLNGKPDLFMGQIDGGLSAQQRLADDKVALQKQLDTEESDDDQNYSIDAIDAAASNKVSEMVAQAGAASGFEGQTLGIGGLDDVLAQVKRRVWIPLAAPPQLLNELGITPVRGLLLYGKPGCGKTLLARKLGAMLSPLRPITVVSGPEIMDKFVGSSEMKLREIFDSPPDIYDFVREQEPDHGDAIATAALHVIIMDEFDAIARHRGGRGGAGDQGDAGVARDSVVNQLLAKMDGVAPLVVPTLVIGLTNKRSLIDGALLRPGRFEVQIEVPPPKTVEQRKSILQVHTREMQEAGRLLVRDAPAGTASANMAVASLPSYDELLQRLAEETDGFSGASLAAMCRAAASHALERAVEEFAQQHETGNSLLRDCAVTVDDFEESKKDFENLDASDYDDSDDENEAQPEEKEDLPLEEDADIEI